MRIVAGRYRGRSLRTPDDLAVRPTADRTREALFNILAHSEHVELDGARVVDCFAGSGALGLEALSRGASHASFVDSHPDSLAALKDNIALLGEGANTAVFRCDATNPPAGQPCTLALLDAPYNSGLSGKCLQALARKGWLSPDALCVVEVAAKEDFTAPDGFTIVDERVYGAAKLVFVINKETSR
jgi:16S rRNA (guanine966-N2)-methyltransferase